jgi:hypothetical protein
LHACRSTLEDPHTDLAAYAHKQRVLQQHCRAVGRDYDEIIQVVRTGVLIAENEAELEWLKEQPFVRPLDNTLIGTPEQITEQFQAIVKQGADRLTVHFADAPRSEGTHLFAEAVMPHCSS